MTFLDITSKPNYQTLCDGPCLALHRQLLPHCGPFELQIEAQNPRPFDKPGFGRFSLCLRIITPKYSKPLQTTSLGSNKVAEVHRLSSAAAEQEDSCSRISVWLKLMQARLDSPTGSTNNLHTRSALHCIFASIVGCKFRLKGHKGELKD